MRRRDFIVGLASATCSTAAWAQRMRRIGVLVGFVESDAIVQSWIAAFLAGLEKSGWNRSNALIETRWAGTDASNIRAQAAALIGLAPDVVFATPHPAAQALHDLTDAIPIVVVQSGDLVSAGFAQVQRRPGGNMTGFTLFEQTVTTKYLQLLKEVAPDMRRVAVVQTENSSWRGDFDMISAVARTIGVEPISAIVREPKDAERLIAAFAVEPHGGLIFPPDGAVGGHLQEIIVLADRYRLPAIYPQPGAAARGGLMNYGTDNVDIYRRAASYVDRILRGEKPGDLPVQGPIKYEFAINLKAAQALGLTIPETLLATADEVIQ